MTVTIERDLLLETEPHQFVAEASELGFRPGNWPKQIKCPGLGNGLNFIRTSKLVSNGDLIYVRYCQSAGCVDIKIFND